MYSPSRSHRRLNFNRQKRETTYQRELPEIRIEAEKRRDKAFERKHRVPTGKIILSQADYLRKYFAY